MATKEISVKKYVVRLSGEERERLETLIRKGKSPARRVLKARILLKADVSEAGKGWSDNRIIEALETSPSMVRIPAIVTTRSDGSRPPVPIDRDQFDGTVRCIF
jgi:arsenate reductase-like glutaredoxin family protein